MKKMLMAAALGLALIFTAAPQAEAYDKFVGTSEATGWDCYVVSESVSFDVDVFYATLKMVDGDGCAHFLNYRFYYDPQNKVMRFNNDEGFSGIVNRYETPIEWQMYVFIDEFLKR